ncbi:MAG: acetyl-CoA acetyltransferase [Antricoccus sp.]
MSVQPIFILGGYQTDFARSWGKENLGLTDMIAESVPQTLAQAQVAAADIETIHVGNLAGELFAGQAQLGGIVVAQDRDFEGCPSARHEAACASGSIAVGAALAEIRAGIHDVALVIGVEQMRNVPAQQAAANLGSAAWVGREAQDADYAWPALFAAIAQEYDDRFGLDMDALGQFAQIAFDNARTNPHAQSRDWAMSDRAFTSDPIVNPRVEGILRKNDCGRITDGAAGLVLAGRQFAEKWAADHDKSLDDLPRIDGFGHTTSTLLLSDKFELSAGRELMFPQLARAVNSALNQAEIADIKGIDTAEVHDCFTISGLMAVEHLGLAEPGEGAAAILDGVTTRDGELPINPGGGLMAAGHPVGATGVRMIVDAAAQVTGVAGESQIDGARTALTVNIGGSYTTVCSAVVRSGC